jgi:hypothetical protein
MMNIQIRMKRTDRAGHVDPVRQAFQLDCHAERPKLPAAGQFIDPAIAIPESLPPDWMSEMWLEPRDLLERILLSGWKA